jgi:hypothetical protein
MPVLRDDDPDCCANCRVAAYLMVAVASLDTAMQYMNNGAQIMVMDDAESVVRLQRAVEDIAKCRRLVENMVQRKQRGW